MTGIIGPIGVVVQAASSSTADPANIIDFNVRMMALFPRYETITLVAALSGQKTALFEQKVVAAFLNRR